MGDSQKRFRQRKSVPQRLGKIGGTEWQSSWIECRKQKGPVVRAREIMCVLHTMLKIWDQLFFFFFLPFLNFYGEIFKPLKCTEENIAVNSPLILSRGCRPYLKSNGRSLKGFKQESPIIKFVS